MLEAERMAVGTGTAKHARDIIRGWRADIGLKVAKGAAAPPKEKLGPMFGIDVRVVPRKKKRATTDNV